MTVLWQQAEQWKTDDDLDQWLKLQGLTNSQAIIVKVIEQGTVVYANGTRRLRYEKGRFYLDYYFEQRTDYGVGKHIDIKALEKRFQSLYPAAHITVRFNTHPNAMALIIYETDKKGHTYKIQLNPAKLNARQVAKAIKEIEHELTK